AHGLGHGHFDRLSWLFYDNGHEVVSDYGAARFLNVVQKNGGRYLPENGTWAKQTVAHNTLVVGRESQFGGDRHAAEEASVEILHFDVTEDLQIVSARDVGSYGGVEITRSMATLPLPGLEHPLVLDVLEARSQDVHPYDLPLYFQGQLIETSPKVVGEREALAPVGTDHGYQHLWALGDTRVEAGQRYAHTWLQGDRFYTSSTVASTDLDVVLTQTGANDPDFNLRREPGLLLRTPPASHVTFFTVLEPHGEYDGAREFTRRSRSRIAAVEGTTFAPGRHLLRLETPEGRSVSLAIATDGDAQTEHSFSFPGGDRRWTGFFHLFHD
ncbi:MAG: heparinase II/III family protein, partial [Acidobacteriota bacterium]